MSDVIGLMSVGDAEHEVYLGREIGHRRSVSEHTARQVDTEVKRILDEAHERAREILEGEQDLMERIAESLLERETLDAGEIQLLADGKPLPPLEKLIIPGAPSNGAPLGEPPALPDASNEGDADDPDGEEDSPEEAEAAEDEESPLTHALDRKGNREEPDREAGLGEGEDGLGEGEHGLGEGVQKELLLGGTETDGAPR